MKTELTYRLIDHHTLTVSWPGGIEEQTLAEIRHFLLTIENSQIDGLQTAYPAYNEVAILFDPDRISSSQLIQKLNTLHSTNPDNFHPKNWLIPVCYEERFAPDLKALSRKLKLPVQDIIDKHCKPDYRVHFFGFQPGFMYLGGLLPSLHQPRKPSPAPTPKGSVAIGGSQTGIYPQDSPGGWHVIGNCPLKFFDPHETPPCFIAPGDTIRFTPISIQEYKVMELELRLEVFDYDQILKNG